MTTYYPPPAFHFGVEFDLDGIGDQDFRFHDVSGLSMELDEETHSEGGENRFVHKLPVRGRYETLTLKRGLLTDSVVRDWCRAAIQELDIEPVTVWVTILNEAHEPLQTYTVVNAWPRKWSISELNAESNTVVVESLDLAYQYFRIG